MGLARLIIALLVACVPVAAATSVQAQNFGKPPLRILLPFSDEASYVVARMLGDHITAATGQTVVVERRTGATGRIAAEALKNAAPDGNTILFTPIAVPVLAPLVYAKLSFDPATDFAPITHVANFRYAWAVRPDHPARNVTEFVAWARANPGKANFGTAGSGSQSHFVGVLFSQATGVELTHVPYRGASPMATDLMGDQIVSGIDALANLIDLHRAGRVRIIAVSGNERFAALPDVATFREQGYPAINGNGWIGMFTPAGTPPATIARLHDDIVSALRAPAIRARIAEMGAEPTGTTPEQLAAIMAADTARWRPIVKASGFVNQ